MSVSGANPAETLMSSVLNNASASAKKAMQEAGQMAQKFEQSIKQEMKEEEQKVEKFRKKLDEERKENENV